MMVKLIKSQCGWVAVVFAGAAVLLFQLLISALLLDRTGNVPVGFDDSYSYLYGIKKVVMYGSGWPDVWHINKATHFNYLSYNLLFGWLSRLSEIRPEMIFFSSFFWGKVIYVGSLIYWMERRGLKNGLLAMALLVVGLFIGDGSIHGSFWVVPSFWMLAGFLLIDGYIASNDRAGWLALLLGLLIYYNLHPLAVVLLPYLGLYQMILWWKERIVNKKVIKVMMTLVLVILITGMLKDHVSNRIPTGGTQVKKVIKKTTEVPLAGALDTAIKESPVLLSEEEVRVNLIPITIVKQNEDLYRPVTEIISISSHMVVGGLNGLAGILPGVPGLWRGYIGRGLVFYPLLWMMPIWLRLVYRSKYRNWVYSYIAIMTVTLGLSWHSQAYRALIFVWPMTLVIMMVGACRSLKTKEWNSSRWRKLVAWSGAGVLFAFLLFQVYSGVGFVKYIAQQNQFEWNTDACPKQLLERTEEEDFDIFYNSFSGISAFTYYGLDQRHVGRTDKLVQVYPEWLKRYGKLYLVTENMSFDGGSDSVFVEDIVGELKKEYDGGKISSLSDCGFFSIWQVDDTKDSN